MELTNTPLTVKRSPTVHRIGFEKAFNRLPHKEIRAVRKELMDELGWSIANFYYKKNGDTPVRENEIPVIEGIFKRYDIRVWAGQ
jgi:hypothetical protein